METPTVNLNHAMINVFAILRKRDYVNRYAETHADTDYTNPNVFLEYRENGHEKV